MSDKKYLTIVFEYESGSKTVLEMSKCFGGEYGDTVITAMSTDDLVTRFEELEEKLEDLE